MAAICHSFHCIAVLAGDNRNARSYPFYCSTQVALVPGTFGYFRAIEQTACRYELHSWFLEALHRLAGSQNSHCIRR